MTTEAIDNLSQKLEYLSNRPSLDYPAFNCPQDRILDCLQYCKKELGFDLLCDVTAIDHFETSPRFEVVYHLYSTRNPAYVRIVTPCVGDENPEAASVTGIWAAADWHERETYDMFGIQFTGHPDLRRILMWDGYPYYPLRKEFPLAGHEVDLPAADVVERTGVKVLPAPMMGGPFHAGQTGPMSKREPRADDESWTETKLQKELEKPHKPRELSEPKE
ncbi:MAG: NADH-quinone oxidoreductase subunit C [Verrucomicrobia bacterium]|nr:NADH-quinone oxidoreductase subunit C [Verrucomicrobiota bacterium]